MLKKIYFSVAAKRIYPGLTSHSSVISDFFNALVIMVLSRPGSCLTMQNGLADGGDMLIADAFVNNSLWPTPVLKLHGIFPFKQDDYLKTINDREHFNLLLGFCDELFCPDTTYVEGKNPVAVQARARAYRAQASRLFSPCDFLMALADEHDEPKAGGTTETIELALNNKIPVIFISLVSGSISLIESLNNWHQLRERNHLETEVSSREICEKLFEAIVAKK